MILVFVVFNIFGIHTFMHHAVSEEDIGWWGCMGLHMQTIGLQIEIPIDVWFVLCLHCIINNITDRASISLNIFSHCHSMASSWCACMSSLGNLMHPLA